MDDREIDMMLKYVPEYSEDNARNIKNKFAQKAKMKRKKLSLKKLTLIAVASMLLITTLVYADVLDISKIYRIIFGQNSEYVEQYIEPLANPEDLAGVQENRVNDEVEKNVGLTEPAIIQSEYDGIVIKLISAINDENVLRIFATVTDTKADRLGESLDFSSWGLSQGYGGGVEVVDYNNKTKTATVLFTSLGSDHQGSATLSINGFSIGREFLEDLPENNINIGELLKGSTPDTISQDEIWKWGGANRNGADERYLYEKSRLLKSDEMDVPFDNADMFSISNVGFVDGLLHIQVKVKLHRSDLTEGYYINAKFVNLENEVIFEPTARIDFIIDKKYAYEAYVTEPHDEYSEMIFDGITSPEQLKDLSLTIDYMKSPEITEGNWEFSFVVPEKVTTEFQIGREFQINGESLQIDKLSLSPLGITVHLHKNMSAEYNYGDVVSVEYEDGTSIDLNQSSLHTFENESTLIFGGQIVEVEKVQGIIINGERISIF